VPRVVLIVANLLETTGLSGADEGSFEVWLLDAELPGYVSPSELILVQLPCGRNQLLFSDSQLHRSPLVIAFSCVGARVRGQL
jgi:hypothetical protein